MLFELEGGGRVDCEDPLRDQGTTGRVYLSRDGQHAIKILKKVTPDLKSNLLQVIGLRKSVLSSPYWESFYCWPDALVVGPNGLLGVRMPAIPRSYVQLTALVLSTSYRKLPVSERSWLRRLRVAVRLSRAVDWLHKHGIAHSDLSFNNVFADLATGQPYLIDLDGVVVRGTLGARVLGTPDYIAPEVSQGATPSREGDLHSLAVLLHQLLLGRHPLRGPKVYHRDAQQDEAAALSVNAVYISHPTDHSNRPTTLGRGYWPAWLLGPDLDALFVAAFVRGLSAPALRPSAKQWEEALIRLHDRVVTCANPNCEDQVYPMTRERGLWAKEAHCPWCGTFLSTKGLPLLHVLRPAVRNAGGAQRIQFSAERDWWILGLRGRLLHRWHQRVGVLPGSEEANTPVARIDLEGSAWVIRALNDERQIRSVRDGRPMKPIRQGEAIRLSPRSCVMLGDAPTGRALYVQES